MNANKSVQTVTNGFWTLCVVMSVLKGHSTLWALDWLMAIQCSGLKRSKGVGGH